MLNFMSSSQIASLFIGIAFSVLAVAGIILVVKYSKAINSFSKSLAISLICPFIAYVSWMFLILSYVDGFKKDELLNLIISILLGVVLIVTVMIVARTLYLKHYAEFEEDAIAPENTDEVISNQNIVEVNGENSQEEAETEETEVAETEEIAETEENEAVETEEAEEVAETEEETEETENKDIDSKLVDALILTQILDEKEQEREQENNNEQIESEETEENEVVEEISNAEEVNQETEQEEVQENVEETSENEQKIVEETEMPIENVEEAEEQPVEEKESVKEDDGLEDVEIESNSENNNDEETSQEEKEIDDFMDEIRALLDEKEEPKHTLTQDEIDDLEFEKYLDSLKKKNEDEEN